jgi:2-dehydro-3-deoxyphosphogluconate aldolase / (4S)-4-hydroxy-2-oxoglutarate aldolase
MDKKTTLLKLIPEQGILPLYFNKDRTVEYTNRGEAALENFKKMRELCDTELKEMYLGIGTIKNREMAQTFIDAGADFIICPGLVEDVAKVADENNLLWVPGCMTPTEIIRAETLGAKMIKLFPGNILGPEFMSAIKTLFPGLLFMPTGGVDLDKENISKWLKAGVCAVGMGSKLISNDLLEQKDYTKIEKLGRQALEILKSLK